MTKHLTTIITILYRLMMLAIIISLMFANKIPYNEFHKRAFAFPNWILLPIGVLAILAIRALAQKVSITRTGTFILFAIMLIAPVIESSGAAFMTGWDAGKVCRDALNLAQGGSIIPDYYSVNPNNRLILIIITTIAKAGVHVGLSGTASLYMLVVYVQCMLFWLTGLLVYDYLKMQSGNEAAFMGGIIYTIFVGMSPWVYIVYTDAMGLIFPVLILWLSRKINGEQWWVYLLKWSLILIVTVVGYNIKAPAFIMFIAVFLALIISMLSDLKPKKILLNIVLIVLITMLGAFLMRAGNQAVNKAFVTVTDTQRDEEMAVSPYYYLMMGHNYDRDGTVNNDDMTFSLYISDYSERVSQTKARLKDRVKELWPDKLIYLYIRKLTMNYNDGSFGYALGGEGFISEKFSEDAALNSCIRYFYWPGRDGFTVYLNMAHILWLGILSYALLFKPKNKYDLICSIAILGITAFTLLFEAQARYLFVMTPMFIVVAVQPRG